MIVVFVEVFGAFGQIISETIKAETRCFRIPRASASQIILNATGKTTPFTYLGGAIIETLNLSVKTDWRIRARWMSFKRYTRELYGCSKAAILLHLK